MIKCSMIRMAPDHTEKDLLRTCAAKIGVRTEDIRSWKILRRSIEARKKEPLSYVYSMLFAVAEEEKVRAFLQTPKGRSQAKKHAIQYMEKEDHYCFPVSSCSLKGKKPPVIIGSGPAGLLCAYELSRCGLQPVVIERGKPASERIRAVKDFWENGNLDPECNVQFGEGGAGTFSDGKLNTGVTDKAGRMKEVLELFVRCGAPETILYDAMPHIGSDILPVMAERIRKEIIFKGGSFLFSQKAEDLVIRNGSVQGIVLSDGTVLETEDVILAIGHSARDTFSMLYRRGVKMVPKAFAVGVRCEHDQEMINRNQWGEQYPKCLGAAPYKLTYRTEQGRSVYTFCMCPGGYVVNASSEPGGTAVNGMSLSGRNSGRANSAVIVSVAPEDYSMYASADVPPELGGMAFQRDLEQKAFEAGGGRIPVQYLGDFLAGVPSGEEVGTAGAHCGRTAPADLRMILPEYVCDSLKEGFEHFTQRIPGFTDPETLLYAVESRTSSPVRIVRNEAFQSNISGLYPCGEGAGYAGGIMSAAIDGIKTAEAVACGFACE